MKRTKFSFFTILQILIKIQNTKIIKINFTLFQSLKTYNNNNNNNDNNNDYNRAADAKHHLSLTLKLQILGL